MTTEQLIANYLAHKGQKKISNPMDFRHYIESNFGVMDRPLFVAKGNGGGQGYKIRWNVMDVNGNANRPCYFYATQKSVITYLESHGHIQLKDWLKPKVK